MSLLKVALFVVIPAPLPSISIGTGLVQIHAQLHCQVKRKGHICQEIFVGIHVSLMNIYIGMGLALGLAQSHYQVRSKGQQLGGEISAGILVCRGSGFIGTKLAKKIALLPYYLKIQEVILQDNFAGIHVLRKRDFCIGMALVWANVLNLC